MRFLKLILLLLVSIFILFQVLYNLGTLNTQLIFSLRMPGENPVFKINFLIAAILFFTSGFGIAIMIEVYFWFKYSRTIRQQNKMIQALRKEVEDLKPSAPAASTSIVAETTPDETKTLEARESAD